MVCPKKWTKPRPKNAEVHFRLAYVAQKRVCFKLHFVIREFNTAQDENSLSLSTFKYKGILKFCFLSAKITLVRRVDNQFP